MTISFVQHPGNSEEIQQNLGIVDQTQIDSALFHLYGFNLWFAAENNMNVIRENVIQLLSVQKIKAKSLDEVRDCNIIMSIEQQVREVVFKLLDDTIIASKAKEFTEYKKWVEERTQSTSSFSM